MKQMGVKFSTKQFLQVKDLSESTGIDKSQVARAAMQLGLEILRKDVPKAYTRAEFIAINNMKSLN